MRNEELYPTEPDTLAAATERFAEEGYRATFHSRDGVLISEDCPGPDDPAAVVVEDFRRFEGATNPDDESAVFAVRCRAHGTRGTLVVSYGPLAGAEDQDILIALGRVH